MSNVSARSVLRFPGGKYRARKLLWEFVPPQTQTVVSPFLGGGSFELFLTDKGIDVVAADNFELLSIFWQELLSHPEDLADFCSQYLGKVDKETFVSLQKELKQISISSNTSTLEVAGKFFIVNRCSFSGTTLSGGFSKDASTSRFTPTVVEKLRDFRNDHITVECLDYKDCIAKNPQADLLFLDPPYHIEDNLYGINGGSHKDFDHDEFFDVISSTDTKFLLTYNDNEYIRDKWKDFFIYDTQWAYGMNSSKRSSEIIVTNYQK